MTVRLLSFQTAQRLAVAAVEACRKRGYYVPAAVVDRNGNLQAFARDPLSGPHAIDVSQGKAYAAATVAPTTEMMENEYLRFAPRALLIGGDVDEECALAGIDAISDELEFAD